MDAYAIGLFILEGQSPVSIGSKSSDRVRPHVNILELSSESETDYKDVLGFSAVFMMYLAVPLLMLLAIFAVGYGTISLWIYFSGQDVNILTRSSVLYLVGALLIYAGVQLSRWLRR